MRRVCVERSRRAPRALLRTVILGAVTVLAAGCTASPAERGIAAESIAGAGRLKKSVVQAGGFTLTTWSRFAAADGPVNVYFEGDGHAWVTREDISSDPTPLNPVALRLAAADDTANVLYVARPCQYRPAGTRDGCDQSLWTSRRFADAVIAAVNGALDRALPTEPEPAKRRLTLIGYSGGGAVALLVAARRTDVAGVVTVAGNVAHGVWTAHQKVSPLRGSLDPIEVASDLTAVPQLHLVGAEDTVVPRLVADSYARRAGPDACIRIVQVTQTNHQDGWLERWPTLLRQMPACPGRSAPDSGRKAPGGMPTR
jgi:hypothetical protein